MQKADPMSHQNNFCQKTNIMGLFYTQLHSVPLWLFDQKVDLRHVFWRFAAQTKTYFFCSEIAAKRCCTKVVRYWLLQQKKHIGDTMKTLTKNCIKLFHFPLRIWSCIDHFAYAAIFLHWFRSFQLHLCPPIHLQRILHLHQTLCQDHIQVSLLSILTWWFLTMLVGEIGCIYKSVATKKTTLRVVSSVLHPPLLDHWQSFPATPQSATCFHHQNETWSNNHLDSQIAADLQGLSPHASRILK